MTQCFGQLFTQAFHANTGAGLKYFRYWSDWEVWSAWRGHPVLAFLGKHFSCAERYWTVMARWINCCEDLWKLEGFPRNCSFRARVQCVQWWQTHSHSISFRQNSRPRFVVASDISKINSNSSRWRLMVCKMSRSSWSQCRSLAQMATCLDAFVSWLRLGDDSTVGAAVYTSYLGIMWWQ